MPCGAQDTKPILTADLVQFRLTISGGLKSGNEVLKSRRRSDRLRDERAVEVGSDGHAVYAQALHQMVDMTDHVADRSIRLVAPIGAQHGDGEVQPDDAVA